MSGIALCAGMSPRTFLPRPRRSRTLHLIPRATWTVENARDPDRS